ncbi:MAG: hypothetical protein U0V75_17425 [Ferruginibacter sp.]
MSRYNIFLGLFIVSTLAAILFFIFYIQAIFGFAFNDHDYLRNNRMPWEFFGRIFNPQVVFSIIVASITSLAYRIMGIVMVAKNKTVSDGEKALWIVGFVIMSFVTSIVFLIMARGRKFAD